MCLDPLLGGVQEALKIENLRSIIDRYAGMIDVFLPCIDRDGQVGQPQKLDTIERNLGALCSFLSENAWEELETWTLAGLDLPRDWQWNEIRAEVSVKGRYFDILAIRRGVADGPGGGRKVLGEEAARRVDVIRQKCHEDFGSIAGRWRYSALVLFFSHEILGCLPICDDRGRDPLRPASRRDLPWDLLESRNPPVGSHSAKGRFPPN